MINVYELIGKKDLMDLTDAEILKNKIKELLQKDEKNKKIIISFSGIEMIYTIFLQKSIGELYLEIEDITDLDKIEFKNLNEDEDLLEYIIWISKYERTKMDNQHRKIKGYRELNQDEIDAMNEVKAMGNKLSELVEKLENNKDLDQRWIESGKTDLQKGLMALTRSIARPEFF